MRNVFVAILLACALSATAIAQPSGQSEMLTVDNTSGGKAITRAVLTGMGGCSLRLATAEIRWSIDQSNPPTTTYGQLMEVGDIVVFTNIDQARNARFIRTTSTSGILAVQCWPQS